ncbi:6-phosphogluconolactonase [Frankia sp. CcI156]|uniref:6-phosphogluconolactonase n=1 Tax=Frankia casuarinae (strain DSM 45818 / CECT 9043 / HFP020203 / CcI3) TaxID=106370 RepID=Q2JCH1_FRACC|nr:MULTISPECIES: 6-phosphogluconolactonase [Frankia]ABD11021.1 6-phosphogluconolactonase [Frankia casuarinae]ETA00969.1 6-phosphogluconolactonase [Frankia sp. CcI6]EYT91354.1 6-phosphogluconolactonase [Frankia casuarinae]KDA41959.1 6-phosphogluconolactonase [Frankia sp. BMG5.23]KEZ37459.1 6-phosphogluconolactonase [Frankia sp. CeD]
MTAEPELVLHRDAGVLARAAAARLITRLVDAQTARGEASLVLTGGGIGIALLRAVRSNPALDAVDWGKVDIWWGDERFVAAGSPDRNERQAREALLDHIPVDPKRIFPMGHLAAPTAGGDVEGRASASGYTDPESAAAEYTALLATRAVAGSAVPSFDVVLLGLGPEGHVASLFPDSPAVVATEPVVAVHDCPKPPPERVTLTLPAIQSAHEVWVIVAGEEKADAVAASFSGAGPITIPATGAVGRDRSLWLADRAAASRLPGWQ